MKNLVNQEREKQSKYVEELNGDKESALIQQLISIKRKSPHKFT